VTKDNETIDDVECCKQATTKIQQQQMLFLVTFLMMQLTVVNTKQNTD